MRIRFDLDALGVCASTLCMIHCLVFPLLLVALPLWNLSSGTDDSVAAEGLARCVACCSTSGDFWIHAGFLATVAPMGLVAWGAGYRHHRRLKALGLGAVGVLLLFGALLFGHQLFGRRGEQVMTVTGSICMVSAHLWNRCQCRCCRSPDLAHIVDIEPASPAPRRFSRTNT